MSKTPVRDLTLACVVDAIPAAERSEHFALAIRLFGSLAQERRPLPDGYAFRFDAGLLADVARFIENERKCCPFLAFHVGLASGETALWLQITGPDGTAKFLDAELRSEHGLS